jgi:hypothetical protein
MENLRKRHHLGDLNVLEMKGCFACCLLLTGFLLGLLFYPKDKGNNFFQNVC